LHHFVNSTIQQDQHVMRETIVDEQGNETTDVELIIESGYFDLDYYLAASGCEMGLEDAVHHFIEDGEPLGLCPGARFEVEFYKNTYPDVALSGMNSLLHFILHGEAENRYATMQCMERDIAVITGSGLFDTALYAKESRKTFFSARDAVKDYLLYGESVALLPCKGFDRDFYRKTYDDVSGNAFAHYLSVGISEARIGSAEKLKWLTESRSVQQKFDAEMYREQAGLHDAGDDELRRHYFSHGVREGLEPAPWFDYEFYISNNPDLKSFQTLHLYQLFWHYCEHGEKESRPAGMDLGQYVGAGDRTFSAARKTFICVVHDSSRTGAPLVALNLVRLMSKKYNIITLTGRKGELDAAFARFSCLYGHYIPVRSFGRLMLKKLGATGKIDFAVTNSVETLPFAQALADAQIPSVALVHEFAEYSMPKGKVADMVAASDRCIFPAQLVYQSLRKELKSVAMPSDDPSNCVIRPQGLLPFLPKSANVKRETVQELRDLLDIGPDDDVKVVVGAGYVQPRKGVDLFVQTAARFKHLHGDDFRFLWVGDGYKPETDINFSIWVRDAIVRAGLEKQVVFLEPQSDLEQVFELADVFFLPSRLDPFPNVVIDALQAELPVVCFDKTTGCAGFLQDLGVASHVAQYMDVDDAAAGLKKCLDPDFLASFPSSRQVVADKLDFADYTDFVELQANIAREGKVRQSARIQALLDGTWFDPLFYAGNTGINRKRDLVREHVLLSDKQLARYAPGPGHDVFLQQDEAEADAAPTHRCYFVTETERLPAADAPRAAVHIHLHYPDLAGSFVDAFEPFQEYFDFFVSTNDEENLEVLEAEFGGFDRVQFAECPNRGRNFGPLFSGEFVDKLRTYDLVGHFHGKKSMHSGDENGFGAAWRRFLIGSLAGSKGELIPFILQRFAADPQLGLLFPEDRHLTGWGANKSFAESLVADMGLAAPLPDYGRFPLGSMFWARSAVLDPFWRLGLAWDDYPREPLPYDGSILHAMERLLPVITDRVGMNWGTIYKAGEAW
jgi:glycosyltransferase involved in cell wall biosynthesis